MSPHTAPRLALAACLLGSGLLWAATIAAAPSAPRGSGPAPSNTCFLYGVYRDVLGRPPGGAEQTAGLAYLSVPHTHAEFATTLLTGDEYRLPGFAGS